MMNIDTVGKFLTGPLDFEHCSGRAFENILKGINVAVTHKRVGEGEREWWKERETAK